MGILRYDIRRWVWWKSSPNPIQEYSHTQTHSEPSTENPPPGQRFVRKRSLETMVNGMWVPIVDEAPVQEETAEAAPKTVKPEAAPPVTKTPSSKEGPQAVPTTEKGEEAA